MKLRQRGNPNKNQKDYICNTPVRPKKKGGGGGGADIFWFPRAFQLPHLTHPPPPHLTIPSFLSLACHSHSCSPFLFLFQSTQHTYTHSSPSSSHRYIPYHHLYHFFGKIIGKSSRTSHLHISYLR